MGTPHQLRDSSFDLMLGDTEFKPSKCVRNLGAFLDAHMSLQDHIAAVCKRSMMAIRQIGKIRKYVDKKTAEMLVNCLVTPHIDYCNSLLMNMSDKSIYRLQRIQNICARLIVRQSGFIHISPVIRALHWLPVRKRCIFKTLKLLYFAVHSTAAPRYLAELVSPYFPSRKLRSSSDNLLSIPRTRCKTLGERAFSFKGPAYWNKLPNSLRTCPTLSHFKKALKTFLFSNM